MKNKAAFLLPVCAMVSLLFLLWSCDGGGGGNDGAAPSPQVGGTPSILNLQYSPKSAVVSPGGVATVAATFDFADDGGDVSSLTLTTFDPAGNQLTTQTSPIQGTSGMQTGSITATVRVGTGALGNFGFQIFVTDAAGLRSNIVSGSFRVIEMPWTTKTSMPAARTALAAVGVSDLIYAIGGVASDLSTQVVTVEKYDPATNVWTAMTSMPTARSGLGAAVVDGKIYAVGGTRTGGEVGVVEEYNAATDTWAAKSPMPTRRGSFGIGTINGKVYAAGGTYWITATTSRVTLQTLEEYDPATDTWTTRSPMPTARYAVASAVVNGKLLVIGGYLPPVSSTAASERTNVVEAYDPVTDTWTTMAPMPTSRASAVAAMVDGMIYVIGGIDEGGTWNDSTEIDQYSPVTDTWITKIPMPTGRSYLAASAAGGMIYAIGGTRTFVPTNMVEEYDPAEDP